MNFHTIRAITVFAAVVTGFGCGSLRHLTRSSSGTEFTVQISTDQANKQEIYDKAVRMLGSKINAIGLDADVLNSPDTPGQIKVTVYGNEPLDPVRKTLFTIYRLELKSVPGGAAIPTAYSTEDAARAVLKDGQEILPIKQAYDNDKHGFLIVEKQDVVNGDDIRKASPISRTGSDYSIEFQLKPDAAEKFGKWTESHIQNYLAIVLNDEVLSYPVIKGKITDMGEIEGRFTESSARDIALSLNAGYLPAAMTIVSERPFGK